MEPSKKPLNLLIKKINQDVTIKLKNNAEYKGKMIECDGYMNIILEKATEYKSEGPITNFGSVIIRGNNVLYICVEDPKE